MLLFFFPDDILVKFMEVMEQNSRKDYKDAVNPFNVWNSIVSILNEEGDG